MGDLMRAVIDAAWPEGSAWTPEPGGDLDNLLDGMAENSEVLRDWLEALASIRNPNLTTFLEDLENEYGRSSNTGLTEEQRRAALAPLVFDSDSNGSVDRLQSALDSAGFNVTVYENDPAVDPAPLLTQAFLMVAGGGNAFAGRIDAFARAVGGELLVNGDIFNTSKLFTSGASTANAFAGSGMTAGEYEELERVKIEYPIPTDPDSWPFVFFVGGDLVGGDISIAEVPAIQEQEIKRIILKYKPAHSWAALLIGFV